ncbi:hypothetical protein DIPPA_32481 [Diplonema papillatum]|nr:hypothetical protein DIPPA_32481 [Diplonema papillatum]
MAHPDPVVDPEAVVWDGGAHRHERSLSRPPGSGGRGQSEGGAQLRYQQRQSPAPNLEAADPDRLSRRAWGQPRVVASGGMCSDCGRMVSACTFCPMTGIRHEQAPPPPSLSRPPTCPQLLTSPRYPAAHTTPQHHQQQQHLAALSAGSPPVTAPVPALTPIHTRPRTTPPRRPAPQPSRPRPPDTLRPPRDEAIAEDLDRELLQLAEAAKHIEDVLRRDEPDLPAPPVPRLHGTPGRPVNLRSPDPGVGLSKPESTIQRILQKARERNSQAHSHRSPVGRPGGRQASPPFSGSPSPALLRVRSREPRHVAMKVVAAGDVPLVAGGAPPFSAEKPGRRASYSGSNASSSGLERLAVNPNTIPIVAAPPGSPLAMGHYHPATGQMALFPSSPLRADSFSPARDASAVGGAGVGGGGGGYNEDLPPPGSPPPGSTPGPAATPTLSPRRPRAGVPALERARLHQQMVRQAARDRWSLPRYHEVPDRTPVQTWLI